MPLRPVLLLVLLVPLLGAAPQGIVADARQDGLSEVAPPPVVSVTRAVAGTLAETMVLTGTLVAREEVLVNPQLDGLALTRILVEEGDQVVAGQILAELSHDVLDASLAQNAAQVERAEAGIAQAGSNIDEAEATHAQADAAFARSRALVTSGTASRETYEQRQQASQIGVARLANTRTALRLADADRALALAQRQELLVRLARTQIRAPVAGIVSRRVARLGAVVGMTGDPLFRIIEDGAVELEADVPENRLGRLRPGQAATIEAPAIGGTPLAATVRLVSPEVNRTSRLGRARIAFDTPAASNPGIPPDIRAGVAGVRAGEIRPPGPLIGAPILGAIGAFARARIEVARASGIIVPLSAVLFEPDGPKLQVVREGLVETRAVDTGPLTMTSTVSTMTGIPKPAGADRSVRGGILVTRGLAVGEEVVAVSASFVRNGDRVTAVAMP